MAGYIQKKLIRADYLAAQPGYYRLEAWLGDGEVEEVEFNKQAVIGWRVRTYALHDQSDGAHTTCDPIVACSEVEDLDMFAILRPDGMVEEYDEIACTLDDWKRAMLPRLVEKDRLRANGGKAA